MISLSFALGTAATALVSRAYGAGKVAEFVEANRKVVSISIISGLLLTGVGYFIAPLAAAAFIPADNPRAAELLIVYMRVFLIGLPAIFLIQTLAGSLRGIGDTKSPMYISGMQVILHIVLNYLLIFPPRTLGNGFTVPGFDLGLAGAALAFAISAWIAALIYILWSVKTPLEKSLGLAMPSFDWVRRILRIATPAALMSVTRVTSLMAFTYILKFVPQSSSAIAAIRPSFSIEALAFMPSFGLTVAAGALVGQSLGMLKPERAYRLGWAAAHQAAIVSTAVAVIMFVFADPIAGFILPDQPDVAPIVASYLRFISVTEIMFAYGMVLIGAMQGAGDTIRPFWMTLLCMWLLRVPLAWVFAIGFGMGVDGAWLSLSITQLVQGLIAIWLWKKGHWRTTEV